MRGVKWVLIALVVLIIGGVVALGVVERPKLDDARTAVDTAWTPLQAPLHARYAKLDAALGAFSDAGAGNRAVAKDLRAALARWDSAVKSGNPGSQATAADQLEAQGTRLRANVLGSVRLKGVTAVTDAITAYDGSVPSAALVSAYNQRVRHYEKDRTSAPGTPVARVLGYQQRPVLVLGS
jgi:hypothetical protein